MPEEKQTVADDVRNKIIAVANTATADDRKRVGEIIALARKGEYCARVDELTPPMSAILFLEHNPHNRDWRPEGPKSCLEYARRMTADQWRKNNAAVGFYVDGQLEDGQHRLSAAAVAGYTLHVVLVFGIERDAIVTVDDGLNRHAADAAKLDGISEARAKQTIIKMASAYRVKAGDKAAGLKSESEIAAAIKANNELLDESIEIGNASMQNVVEAVLKAAPAQTLAFIMLTSGWPTQRVREKLALFQTGVSKDGEKTPYFVAADLIKHSRKKAENRDKLSTVKELGVAVYAMVASENGIKAVTPGALRAAVKKELPSAAFPEPMKQAA